MSEAIEIQSRVGRDGVLDLHVPLGAARAGADVVVTIRPAPGASEPAGAAAEAAEWHAFVEETYGSCAGLGLERQEQGTYEAREAIE